MPSFRPYLILVAVAGVVAATAMSGSESASKPHPVSIHPQVGEPVAPDNLHLIDRPGLYGVADPAPGMQYAVVGSSLVRIDTATHIVRSIIRGSVRPLD